MSRRPDTDDQGLLDRAVDALRDDAPSAEATDAAAREVRQRLVAQGLLEAHSAEAGRPGTADDATSPTRPLRAHALRDCADYRAAMPALLAGELSEAPAARLEEHARRCLPCRKALTALREKRRTESRPAGAAATPAPASQGAGGRSRWARPAALAAAVALVLLGAGALAMLWNGGGLPFGPAPVLAEIETVDGALLRLGEIGDSGTVETGTPVRAGERLRTTKGSAAVLLLEDGTRIEMGERAELSLRRGLRGRTVHLDGGPIIVEAAEQRRGKLYVATDDCLVSVVGTVFTVNHGFKGSRVSVLEGEVEVARKGSKDVLRPGQQMTTDPALQPTSLEREVAWSRNREHYDALLAELTALRDELSRRVPVPEQRFTSDLLPLVPAATSVYLAGPNLAETLETTYRLLQEQLEESPRLRELWQSQVVEPGLEPELEALLTQVADLGSYLGEEVVMALAPDAGPEDHAATSHEGPVVLARVLRTGLAAYLEQELARLQGEHGRVPFRLVDDPLAAEDGLLLLWTDGDYLVVTPSPAVLRGMATSIATGGSGFAGTPFHHRLEDAYGRGVEWLLAADLEALVGPQIAEDDEVAAGAREAGVDNLRYLMVERRPTRRGTEDRRSETAVEVTFDGPRRGVASWLAEPSPLRALDFVSPEAPLVLGVVTREPIEILDDLHDLLESTTGTAVAPQLDELQRQLGVDLEADLAAAVGGELAFSFDGPVLQGVPWKLLLEVYDPIALQRTIETLASRLGESAGEEIGFELTSETVGSRTFHVLHLTGAQVRTPGSGEIHYTFEDGFLVATPTRVLLERALQIHDGGAGLVISERFRSLLPADSQTHVSALFFQDTGQLTEGLGELGLTELPPSLAVAYGLEDSIRGSLVTAGDPLGTDLLFNFFLGMGGTLGPGSGAPAPEEEPTA